MWGGCPELGGQGGEGRCPTLSRCSSHVEKQLALGLEHSRQLRVESLILIRITRNPGASYPLSALNAQQLWEGGREAAGEASKDGSSPLADGGREAEATSSSRSYSKSIKDQAF